MMSFGIFLFLENAGIKGKLLKRSKKYNELCEKA